MKEKTLSVLFSMENRRSNMSNLVEISKYLFMDKDTFLLMHIDMKNPICLFFNHLFYISIVRHLS